MFLRGDFDFDEELSPAPVTSFDYTIMTTGVETAWVVLMRDASYIGLRIELRAAAPLPVNLNTRSSHCTLLHRTRRPGRTRMKQ